jgi:hypothetical protein
MIRDDADFLPVDHEEKDSAVVTATAQNELL